MGGGNRNYRRGHGRGVRDRTWDGLVRTGWVWPTGEPSQHPGRWDEDDFCLHLGSVAWREPETHWTRLVEEEGEAGSGHFPGARGQPPVLSPASHPHGCRDTEEPGRPLPRGRPGSEPGAGSVGGCDERLCRLAAGRARSGGHAVSPDRPRPAVPGSGCCRSLASGRGPSSASCPRGLVCGNSRARPTHQHLC